MNNKTIHGNKEKKLSKEHREKIGKANKGRVPWTSGLTKETDKRLAAISKKFKGRKQSKEWIEKRAKAHKGYKHTEESKEKIRIAHLGKKRKQFTKEHKENISKALIGKKFSKDRLEKQRKSYTEERNLKISLALTGRSLSKKHRLAVSKGLTKTILLGKFNPKQYRGIRNSFYSKKNKCIIYCMSKMERAYCDLLEQITEVKYYKMQPCRIQYTFNKEKHYYIPDILIIYKSGKQELVEIKPFRAIKDKIVQHKAKYAKKYCKENGLIFKFVTDKNIFC